LTWGDAEKREENSGHAGQKAMQSHGVLLSLSRGS
jgi:hypothetical protein